MQYFSLLKIDAYFHFQNCNIFSLLKVSAYLRSRSLICFLACVRAKALFFMHFPIAFCFLCFAACANII